MKTQTFNIIALMALLFATSCANDDDTLTDSSSDDDDDTTEVIDNSEIEALVATYVMTTDDELSNNATTHEESDDTTWDDSDYTLITLNETSVTIDGDGATASGSYVTINSGGNYKVEGSLTDGQLIVDTDDETTVKIYLDGVTIANSTNAPFNAASAEKVVVFLAEGTTNTFTDATTYVYEDDDDEPNAAFFSKTDLTITGNGTLDVSGNYNDGIASKDGLIITNEATISVTAEDDGIRGKDYLVVTDATIDVIAGGDGFKSDNDDDTTYGYIYTANANITIDAANDGMQAESDVLIASGTIDITTAGGSSVVLDEDASSAKALKAESYIIIDNGTLSLDAADDAFNSANTVIINDGTLELATGDDALHADNVMGIYGGTITVSTSYEGIEGSTIVIDGGTIHVTSSDDGINAAGEYEGSNAMYISGGYTVVNASGDGVDSNGSIDMIGGTLLVNGPTANNNGPLDYDDIFTMNGGEFVAAGSSGMAQTASNSSALNALLIEFNSQQAAGTLINITDESGTNIMSFAPEKTYSSIAYASAALTTGTTYTVTLGGTDTGSETDGWYTNGTHSGGSTYTTFTIESTITSIH